MLLPFGESTRYDLAVERDGVFKRVQSNTGRLERGAIYFRTARSHYHHPHPKMPAKHYRGQVDCFAVYCGGTGGVYLVPIDDLPTNHWAGLRVDPPRNHQYKRIRFAADYEIGRVAIEGLRAPSGA